VTSPLKEALTRLADALAKRPGGRLVAFAVKVTDEQGNDLANVPQGTMATGSKLGSPLNREFFADTSRRGARSWNLLLMRMLMEARLVGRNGRRKNAGKGVSVFGFDR
jgi:hypothetical protein